MASGNDASFFETEVAAATRSRTSDNDMVNEVDLQNAAGFVDPAREASEASDEAREARKGECLKR
jgi:hypothetical protein